MVIVLGVLYAGGMLLKLVLDLIDSAHAWRDPSLETPGWSSRWEETD